MGPLPSAGDERLGRSGTRHRDDGSVRSRTAGQQPEFLGHGETRPIRDRPEGGTATFGVKLTVNPGVERISYVAYYSGDSDISVAAGSPIIFNSSNWNTYQTVTVSAASDADSDNGTALRFKLKVKNEKRKTTAKNLKYKKYV